LSGESARDSLAVASRTEWSRARRSRIDLFRLYNGLAAALAELIVAAQAPHFGSRVQKDFDFGMGKDNGADVAALHDHATGFAQLLLQANHPGANGGKDADARGRVGDDLIAQQAGDVFAVEQDAVFLLARLEMNGGFGGELFKARGGRPEAGRRAAPSGEGAVHGAGFKVEQAEMAGQMPGNGALAGAGGPVNRDDHLPARRFGTGRDFPRFIRASSCSARRFLPGR
jgi:hypothetical protein